MTIFSGYRRLNIFSFPIEVIVLVLCEFFPPLFAPGQGHLVQKGDLVDCKVAIALESMEGPSEIFLFEQRNERSELYALHFMLDCLLLFLQLVLGILLEILCFVSQVGILCLELVHSVPQFSVLVA